MLDFSSSPRGARWYPAHCSGQVAASAVLEISGHSNVYSSEPEFQGTPQPLSTFRSHLVRPKNFQSGLLHNGLRPSAISCHVGFPLSYHHYGRPRSSSMRWQSIFKRLRRRVHWQCVFQIDKTSVKCCWTSNDVATRAWWRCGKTSSVDK